MSVRFVIRKNRGPVEFPWEMRDGKCPNSESHMFEAEFWSRGCVGDCNAYYTYADAVDSVHWKVLL